MNFGGVDTRCPWGRSVSCCESFFLCDSISSIRVHSISEVWTPGVQGAEVFHVAKVFRFRQVELRRSISEGWTPGVHGAEVFHVAKASCIVVTGFIVHTSLKY